MEFMRVRDSFVRAIKHLLNKKQFGHKSGTRDELLSEMQTSRKCTLEVIEAISELSSEFDVDEAVDFLTHHRLNVFDEAAWTAWAREFELRRMQP